MTLRKAVFEVACDTNGMGYDDIRLRPSISTRKARVEMVTLDRRYEEASTGTERIGFGRPTITLIQLDDVSGEDWNDSAEDYALGKQLVFIDTKVTQSTAHTHGDEWAPRHAITTTEGVTPTYDVLIGQELIDTNDVRCEINGANSGDYFRVTLYYETAGDYRF